MATVVQIHDEQGKLLGAVTPDSGLDMPPKLIEDSIKLAWSTYKQLHWHTDFIGYLCDGRLSSFRKVELVNVKVGG